MKLAFIAAAVCVCSVAPRNSVAECTGEGYALVVLDYNPRTWAIYLQFSDPRDQLLGVVGTPDHPLELQVYPDDVPLRNTAGPFSGLPLEDTPLSGLVEPWDSWVTIGSVDRDDPPLPAVTSVTDGAFGVPARESAIQGTHLLETNGGGWMHTEPDTNPVTGYFIQIGQFTAANLNLDGVARWRGVDGVVHETPFSIWTQSDPDVSIGVCCNAISGACSDGHYWNCPYDASSARYFLDGEDCRINPCDEPYCPGDTNADSAVGFDDLLAVLSALGEMCVNGLCPEDITWDRRIDYDDLLVVLAEWGPCDP